METVLLYVLGIVAVAVGLAVSIALHELGHLVPAKLFGVRVGQYMIGFGPTLWSRRRGETEYGFKAIPLGGYISMAGMFPPAQPGTAARSASTGFFQTMIQDARTVGAGVEDDRGRMFYTLPVWKRVIIMSGGPAMNLVIAIVLFAVMLCGFGIREVTTTVGSVNACLVAQTGERAAGEQAECAPGDPIAPAAQAGLLPGDRLVSVDGAAVTRWEDATRTIQASAGKNIRITVERDGAERTLTATPALTERYRYGEDNQVLTDSAGEPVTQKVGMLGISPAYQLVPQAPSVVLPMVWENTVGVANIVLHLPQRIVDVAGAAFGPGERDPNGPMGLVGLGRIAGEITSIDTIPILERASYLVGLVASLNIALLVFNLVPLMPLDGGHIAGALWEGIRRFFAKLFHRRDPGPVDAARLIPLTLAVVVLLGGMSLLLIYADLVKPVTLF